MPRKTKAKPRAAVRLLTVKEAAANWRVSQQRIRQWCSEDPCRIVGVQRFGRAWQIPSNAKRPEPLRPGERIGV